jgi:NAD(P)-dependent dehydrogenase (short-subunit alcohol dehydrogenase family)
MILDGIRAIVTGAARGIGAATARRFCEEGARVVLLDRDERAVTAAAAELEAAGHQVHARAGDVSDDAALRRVVDQSAELLGGLDVALANAGILSVRRLAELSLAEFEHVLRVNVLGTFSTFKHSLPHLKAAGGGVLLCTASQAGLHGYREMSAYCASKFALVGLVESLAQELAGESIRVCAVAPGMTETAMLRELVSERARLWHLEADAAQVRLQDTVPLRRPASPEEVANAFVYLASPAASYVSGIALVLDGGEASG